jgi:hypothetical protein
MSSDMNTSDMLRALDGCRPGSLLFIAYASASKPTTRALCEAQRARSAGVDARHFFGRLRAVWTTRAGDTVMSVDVMNRDTVDTSTGEVVPGGIRTFNPCRGQLLGLVVLERAPAAALAPAWAA